MDDDFDTAKNCFYSNLSKNRNSAIEYRNTSLYIEQSEDGSDKSEEYTPEVLMPISYTSTKSRFFFACTSDDASLNRNLEIVFEAFKNIRK